MNIEKILNKRSNAVVTDGGGVETPVKPTSSQLDNGEIAVNYHKGTERLFIKNDNEEVVEFVSKDEVDKKLDIDSTGPTSNTNGSTVISTSENGHKVSYNDDEIENQGSTILFKKGNTPNLFLGAGDVSSDHLSVHRNQQSGISAFTKALAYVDDIPSVTPQVQSDWNETNTTSKAYILNKPTIPSKTSELNNDSGFLTEHQDISGKQDVLISGTNIKTINNNSIVGSGNLNVGTITGVTINNTTKTPTNGTVDLGTVLTTTTSSVTQSSKIPITSGGVYSALQNYETKLAFTTSSNTSYTAQKNKYCRFTTTLSSLGISLPTSYLTVGDTCAFNFTTSSSFSSFTISGGTIKKMKNFAIEANGTYEVVALYDGVKWLVTVTEFE